MLLLWQPVVSPVTTKWSSRHLMVFRSLIEFIYECMNLTKYGGQLYNSLNFIHQSNEPISLQLQPDPASSTSRWYQFIYLQLVSIKRNMSHHMMLQSRNLIIKGLNHFKILTGAWAALLPRHLSDQINTIIQISDFTSLKFHKKIPNVMLKWDPGNWHFQEAIGSSDILPGASPW